MCTTKLLFWNQFSPGIPLWQKTVLHIGDTCKYLPFKGTRRDLFMSFPTLDWLIILTAEHVYSGRPGDRFRVHGLLRSEITQSTCYLLLIQCLKGATETCFTLLTIFAGKSCGQNNCSFGDYAVSRPFLAKFPAGPLERFIPSNIYMTHPTPLPAWWECRVWLGRCSAYATLNKCR